MADPSPTFAMGPPSYLQLHALAADARMEAEVMRHPTSRAWAELTRCEHDRNPRRPTSAAGHFPPPLRAGRRSDRNDAAVIRIAVDDPFRPKLVEGLS
jgi:hypothetical protein